MKRFIVLLFMIASAAYAQSTRYPFISSGGGTVTSITAGTGLTGGTITGSGTIALSSPVSIANGGTNSTSYTSGSIPYFDGTKLGQDNANFFWDGTNHRLGIGTTSPVAALDIEKAFTTTAATSGAVQIASAVTAHANSDNIAGLYVNPTFAYGGHSGILPTAAYIMANSAVALTLNSDGNDGVIADFFDQGVETLRTNLNGQLLASGLGQGTAAMPDYGFLTDLHSGFFIPMPSVLAFSTASTERLRINNTGVGVGTTNPGAKLEVNGGVRLNTATSRPTCDSTQRGTTWVVESTAGVTDTYAVCLKSAADTYSWVQIVTGG